MGIVFARRARREALEIDDWWRANRPAAARMFARELDAALRLLGAAPHAGRRAEGVRKADTRVLVLHRSRYLVFYRVVDAGLIRILALRHGRREHDATL